MTDEEIKANAFVFLVAGFDTTATVLSFTLFYLAANTQALRKAQKEIDEKLGQVSVYFGVFSDRAGSPREGKTRM